MQLLGRSKLQIKRGITCHRLLTGWKNMGKPIPSSVVDVLLANCVRTSTAIWIRTRKHYSHTPCRVIISFWSGHAGARKAWKGPNERMNSWDQFNLQSVVNCHSIQILLHPFSRDNRVRGSWWKKSEQQTTNLNWLEQGTLCPTNLRFDSGGLEENLSFGMLWARDLEWQWLSWKHVSRCSGLVVVSDKKKYMTCYLSISEFDLRTPPVTTLRQT